MADWVAALRGRMREVRESTGLTQVDFAPRLDAMSRSLYGAAGPRYTQSSVSDIERPGGRSITLEDIAVYAAIDPERRGKVWLGWGEAVDSGMVAPRRQGPSVIQEPPPDTFDQPIPRRKPGQRRA